MKVSPKQAIQPATAVQGYDTADSLNRERQLAAVAATEDDPLLGFIDDCKEKGLPITVANGNKAAHPNHSDEEVPYREEVSPKQAFQPAAAVQGYDTADSLNRERQLAAVRYGGKWCRVGKKD